MHTDQPAAENTRERAEQTGGGLLHMLAHFTCTTIPYRQVKKLGPEGCITCLVPLVSHISKKKVAFELRLERRVWSLETESWCEEPALPAGP